MSRFNLNGDGRDDREIKEDLCGRIELFDQSVRSFEMRLRAVERRLSSGNSPSSGPGFSGPAGQFCEGGVPPSRETGASSTSPLSPGGQTVSPVDVLDSEAGVLHPDFGAFGGEGQETSPFLSLSPSSGPGFASSGFSGIEAVGGQAGAGGGLFFSRESAEKIKEMGALMEGFSESLRALEEGLAELSDFVHKQQVPEIQRLDAELEERKTLGEATASKLEKRLGVIENQSRLTFGSIKVPVEVSGITGALALLLTGSLVRFGRWDIIRSPFFPTGLAVLMALAVLFKFYMINRKKGSSGPETA